MRQRKKRKRTRLTAILIAALALCSSAVVLGLSLPEKERLVLVENRPETAAPHAQTLAAPPSSQASLILAPTPHPTPEPLGIRGIRLRAVGDLMVHERQFLSCVDDSGNYSFDESFASIVAYLTEADLVIGNLETTVAEGNFSGFPSFRSPVAFIDALASAGFDVLTFANNHTFDGQTAGIERTINAVRERGMATTGAFANKEEAEDILVVDSGGIKIGILAYADMAFRSEEWQINTFKDMKKIQRDIDAARSQGADLVCVMAHWGEEYVLTPTDRQIARAKQLVMMGADIVLGSHPHIVQPGEWITAQMPDGGERRGFVFYSMGNFLSNQKPSVENGEAVTDGGVIIDISIKKNLDSGQIISVEVSAIPTFVLRRDRADGLYTYDILPIEAALAVPEGESDLTAYERRRMHKVLTYALSSLGDVSVLSPAEAGLNPDAPEDLPVNMR